MNAADDTAPVTIGTTWKDNRDTYTVVGEQGDRWLVKEGRMGDTVYFEPKATIERRRTVDIANYAYWKKQELEAEEKAALKAEAAAKFAASSVGRYLATLTPIQAAKVRETLLGLVRYNGDITSRARLIERNVALGWRVNAEGLFTAPDGRTFIDSKFLTKTAAKYGAWIVANDGASEAA